MSSFRPYDLDQPYLLPLNLREWLPEKHLALFVNDVIDELDLSAIVRTYQRVDRRGNAAYHPAMMVKLLIYGYCTGRFSSRKIEKACWEDVPAVVKHLPSTNRRTVPTVRRLTTAVGRRRTNSVARVGFLRSERGPLPERSAISF
jgi:hypothetical protein